MFSAAVLRHPLRFDARSLRLLSDPELQSLHRQAQRECVLGGERDAWDRLAALERELLGRRLPCI